MPSRRSAPPPYWSPVVVDDPRAERVAEAVARARDQSQRWRISVWRNASYANELRQPGPLAPGHAERRADDVVERGGGGIIGAGGRQDEPVDDEDVADRRLDRGVAVADHALRRGRASRGRRQRE